MMKIRLKNISMKSIIVIIIVSGLSFGIGLFTAHKTNIINKKSITISKNGASVKMSEGAVTQNDINALDVNEEDPLTHLKMLLKDVETFRALMEEVKNELFVTET